jgi:TorA maturation chaperone TorD
MDALTRPLTAEGVDELDLARSRLYGLLGLLLAAPPSRAALDRIAAALRGGGGAAPGSPLGRALDELGALAAATPEAEAEREYNALFVGVDRGELVPYASYYLTGFLHSRPLARLRQEMAALGLERAPGVPEPEDHIAALCEVMAGLIAGDFAAAPGGGTGERGFFERHLAPWAGRFFRDLERARAARLYRPVGAVGRLLVDIDEAAWAMAPPAAGDVDDGRPGAAATVSGRA